jgi:hypothetical protein
MRTRKSDTVILAGLVGFALAGWLTLGSISCQKKAAEQTAAAATPATEQIATTTTTTTTVEETAPVYWRRWEPAPLADGCRFGWTVRANNI